MTHFAEEMRNTYERTSVIRSGTGFTKSHEGWCSPSRLVTVGSCYYPGPEGGKGERCYWNCTREKTGKI